MQRNRTKYAVKGVSAVLILLAGVGLFFAFSSDVFSGSFPWVLVSLAGGVVVILALSLSVFSQRRKSSNTYDSYLDENFKPLEESIRHSEEDDFIPSDKLSSKLDYDTKCCEYCGTIIEEGINFCVSCGRKL